MSSEDNKPSSTTEEEYKPFPDPLFGTGEDITPAKDGGVLKAIRKEGDTTELDRPRKGDKVYVHYVGTLTNGKLFDSSRSRMEKFSFTLGTGQVIKAWDLGVATMRRGEIAVFTCNPEYAYGKQSKPKIPANSTLVFEVELFDWKGEDLSPDRDEGIIRRIFFEGEGYDTPNEEAKVEINIIGTCDGREFERRDVEFILTEGKDCGIVEGVEIALQRMKKGEVANLRVKPKYAYGSEGNSQYNIPPNADIVYDVMLKNFEKAKETWEMDIGEKLEASDKLKAKGTNYFKQERFADAVKQWKKIITYLETESSLDGEEKQKCETLQLAAHLNIAMATIKDKEFAEAVKACNKAIEFDQTSVKGLFRRGQAYFGLAEYEDAKADFSRVLELEPENKAAKNQLLLSNQKLKQFHQKEKRIYGNMFSRFVEQDEKEKLARERARGDLEVGVFSENGKAPSSANNGEGDGPDAGEEKMDDGVTNHETKETNESQVTEGDATTEDGQVPEVEGTKTDEGVAEPTENAATPMDS